MKDVIVVIGPGQIGQAIARRVAVGKHVLLADLRAENAEAAAQVLGDAGYEVSVATVDVSSREDVHALVDRATSLGDVTGLIHAAGVSPSQASPATILRVEKDAGRDGADDVAALVVAGEVTGQRCEQLARHGGQADEGQARQQDGVGGCQRAGHQCHDGARHDRRDEPASVQGVAQRDHEEDPQRVSRLGERHQEARGADRDVEGSGDLGEQRLGPVEVAHRYAAGDREQEGQPLRHPGVADVLGRHAGHRSRSSSAALGRC